MLHHREEVREAMLREGMLPKRRTENRVLHHWLLHRRQEVREGVLQDPVLR